MLEVMIWENAFPKSIFKYTWNIADFVSSGNRPPTIENVKNKDMRKVIEQCWCQNPKDRLSIEDVVALLETQLLKLK